MALEVKVESLDSIPEALHDYYTQTDDGGYMLDVSIDNQDAGDNSALVKTLDIVKNENKKLKSLAKKLNEVDIDKYRDMLQREEEAEQKRMEEKGQFDAILQQMKQKHQEEIKMRESKINDITTNMNNYFVEREATRAIADAKGVPDLLLPHVKQNLRVHNEDGKFEVQVVDASGNVRIADSSGAPMNVSDYVSELRNNEVFGRAFESSVAQGNGTPQSGGGTVGRKVDAEQLSAMDMDAYMQARKELVRE